MWQLPDGAREVSYKFLSEANIVLGAGKLDGEGRSTRLFTEVSQATAIEIDFNKGKWEQLVTERFDAITSPAGGPELVFDYGDHDEVPLDIGDGEDDDRDLSRYDITS